MSSITERIAEAMIQLATKLETHKGKFVVVDLHKVEIAFSAENREEVMKWLKVNGNENCYFFKQD